jgi:acyl carrier protein
MSASHDVSRRIRGFIESKFPLAKSRAISDDYALLENGIVDSLGILDVVAFIEEEFRMTVADEDLVPENFQSIARLTAFVGERATGLAA